MARQAHITVSASNPNDQIGGGGCLCSDTKRPECRGPYVVFTAVSTDHGRSPHAVACATCLQDAVAELRKEALALSSDHYVADGKIINRGDRAPGYGLRDDGYIPIDSHDALLARDNSPGHHEIPPLEPEAVEEVKAPVKVVLPDPPPAAVPTTERKRAAKTQAKPSEDDLTL